eukprot:3192886-Pyramimonas_sp.AAC.1
MHVYLSCPETHVFRTHNTCRVQDVRVHNTCRDQDVRVTTPRGFSTCWPTLGRTYRARPA